MNKENKDITEEYLMTAANDAELSIIEGILQAEGIPFIKKARNMGGVALAYGSFFNLNVEVYVSSEDLQRAKDAVLNNFETTGPDNEQ